MIKCYQKALKCIFNLSHNDLVYDLVYNKKNKVIFLDLENNTGSIDIIKTYRWKSLKKI